MSMQDHAAREAFRPFFEKMVGHEKGFTRNPKDPGNWTSGRVGVGDLRGTKDGISAGAYPTLDIVNLTQAEIYEIYFRDYWCRCGCDELPPLLKLIVFDASVNCGAGNAARFLQRALKVADDGIVGAITRQAMARAPVLVLAEGIMRERATHHTKLSIWSEFGRGWCIRLATLPFQSVDLADGVADGDYSPLLNTLR